MQDPFDVFESMKGKCVRVFLTEHAIRVGADAFGAGCNAYEGELLGGDDCCNILLRVTPGGAVKLVRGSWVENIALK